MIWTQDNFFRIIGFIADILVTFPLASDLFLKKPPSRKITNNSGICPHLGGNISGGRTAREKIIIFFEVPRCIVCSQKKGHSFIHFRGRYWFFFKKMAVVPYDAILKGETHLEKVRSSPPKNWPTRRTTNKIWARLFVHGACTISVVGFRQTGEWIMKVPLIGLIGNDDQWESYQEFFSQ